MHKRFFPHLFTTYFSQIIGALFGILVIKLIALYLTPEDLGVFFTGKRIVNLGIPLLTLNLGMSLAKFNNRSPENAEFLLLFSFFFVSSIFIVTFIFITIIDGNIVAWLWNDLKYHYLFLGIWVLLYATAVSTICSGYWRGVEDFGRMNLTNVSYQIMSVLVLLFTIIFENQRIHFIVQYFLYNSVAIFLFNILILLFSNFPNKIRTTRFKGIIGKIKPILKSFINFGIRRIPSGFFYMAIFFIPIIAASGFISLTMAAYIGIIISIANLLMLVGFPLNLLFLPKFSGFDAKMERKEILEKVQMVFDFSLSVVLLISPLLYFFVDEIIILLLNKSYMVIGPYMELFSFGVGPFLIFVILRGILDGIENYPYINMITGVGMVVTIILSIGTIIFGWGMGGLTLAFTMGLILMGLGTIYVFLTRIKLQIMYKRNLISFGWVLLLYICFYGFKLFSQSQMTSTVILAKGFIILLVGFLSIWIYKVNQYPWFVKAMKLFNK